MNKKIIKTTRMALRALSTELTVEGALASAIELLLERGEQLGPRLGYYLTVFDTLDPVDGKSRTTYCCGDTDGVATALGMEMIDDKDVRFILNNARINLDLFNESLPENEKLK